MAHFGKIKSYDTSKGTGTIAPEAGGEPLGFAKADFQQKGEEPKVDQRFSYETEQADGGNAHAVNLQLQQGDGQSQKAQASKQQG